MAAYAFAFQIYYDFAGYSDMAIGLALFFGFQFPENFHRPYMAQNIAEFWRRWHISLSTWLRDYLYIPLGGNRHGKIATYRNLLVTMALGGLWHGANWTFLAWGIFHGAGPRRAPAVPRAGRQEPCAGQALTAGLPFTVLSILLTFHCWTISMVVFRAQTIGIAGDLLRRMFMPGGGPEWPSAPLAFAGGGILTLCAALYLLQAMDEKVDLPAMVERSPLLFRVLLVAGRALEGDPAGAAERLAVPLFPVHKERIAPAERGDQQD